MGQRSGIMPQTGHRELYQVQSFPRTLADSLCVGNTNPDLCPFDRGRIREETRGPHAVLRQRCCKNNPIFRQKGRDAPFVQISALDESRSSF